MNAARKLNDAERAIRIEELKVERRAALLQLANGAAVFQMETDEINLTVDVETGVVDGVVLKGKHSGSAWSELNASEKAEVVSVLVQGADIVVKLLELGTESM